MDTDERTRQIEKLPPLPVFWEEKVTHMKRYEKVQELKFIFPRFVPIEVHQTPYLTIVFASLSACVLSSLPT